MVLHIGISYNPNIPLFYNGASQTAITLAELFLKLNHKITFVDYTNNDNKWWDNYPLIPNTDTIQLYKAPVFDMLIDIDGIISEENRKKVSKFTVVFFRTFLQFYEMDLSVYVEYPYIYRTMKNVNEIWCWDILNPVESIPSIQTLFPCPIRRVPFIWSSSIVSYFSTKVESFNNTNKWTVHISEKCNNMSSAIIPIVAIRELVNKNIIDASYQVHNINKIKDNKFFKENILDNIDSSKLPIELSDKLPYYDLVGSNNIMLSHSRFTNLRIGLLNLLWMGIPLIHNSPIIRDLHSVTKDTFYTGNEISGICNAFSSFLSNPTKWYSNIDELRTSINNKFGIESKLMEWNNIINNKHKLPKQEIIISFSDMWGGYNYNYNFITDAIRNEVKDIEVKGVEFTVNCKSDVHIFGPFGNTWKTIPNSIPKVFFTGENLKYEEDPSIELYLTPYRIENDKHIRIPTWMIFIDWFTDSKELPLDSQDNPIRIPIHFAMSQHPIPFNQRDEFCGFVVSNPICKMRNDTFDVVNKYKKVNSGGSLYNNIGGRLSLKYPGGGSGDISKYNFFSKHKFTISFENSQAPGYITEKPLHAKMAGCVPLYWGDNETNTDFVENSIINLSNINDPNIILEVIKKLESNPEFCAKIASTPILDETKKNNALKIFSNMSKRIIELIKKKDNLEKKDNIELIKKNEYLEQNNIKGISKTYVINLDRRQDRWNELLKEEPYLKDNVERVSAVDGKTLQLNTYIYELFKNNVFDWKKSVIGCSLSHLFVWSKILKEKGDYFLILEDDVRFNKNWINDWDKYLEYIPKDADLLYLGGILPPNKPVLPIATESVNKYWSCIKPNTFFSSDLAPIFHFCAYSYIITKSGVDKLLKYINESENKMSIAADHLLMHPAIGLNKYICTPLLSYCFQDNDPVYINSQFNDIHREDTFDSDICNNDDCFTDDEICLIKNNYKKINEITLYYLSYEKEDKPFELYERIWLEDMLKVKINCKPFSFDIKEDNSWYLVQRPYSNLFNKYFEELANKNIKFKVIHLSDEFCNDNISFYNLPNCKGVIRNYIRSDIPKLSHIKIIPLGYHHKFTNQEKTFLERELIWSFHGTDWFDRKKQLEEYVSFVPHSCHLQQNWNDPAGTKEKQYLSILGNSKFCPVLRGNNVETFRLYEALEAGCIPFTNITDVNFINWINDNLKLSELYDWCDAKNVLNNNNMNEEIRQKIITKWKSWKQQLSFNCTQLL